MSIWASELDMNSKDNRHRCADNYSLYCKIHVIFYFFFKNVFGRGMHMSCFRATGTPVIDLW